MKKTILLMTLILASVFMGSLLGELAMNVEDLVWLGKTYDIGISTFDLDLQVLVLTLGCHFKICIAQVLLMLVALVSYPKLAASFFHD